MKDSLTFQTDFWDERLYFVFCPENWTLVGTGCKTSLTIDRKNVAQIKRPTTFDSDVKEQRYA